LKAALPHSSFYSTKYITISINNKIKKYKIGKDKTIIIIKAVINIDTVC
jgi:hypothetical protein